ncbi:hypothetical protein K504DRAFT_387046 [Pleomassaria siparia CBS 279.74]|uniref:SRP9 domain-containing protein n=1 Tax=Pleomassaria siparia CBS 279.74 TaxID=1314801 RepID=A0A6G1K027_9PLEO|nr:hypothetical protein K504DRAFT_387046 [Pleomassaria siparia CBS 279.74]
MPYFKTNTEWYEQSSLLLKARPTTTRITSKYSVLKPTASKVQKRQKYAAKVAAKSKSTTDTSSPPPQSQNLEEPTATFTLKTYDPISGACLQYETTKAAEVGRLIGSLGRLGRYMAALPEVAEELSVSTENAGISTPAVEKDTKAGASAADPKAGGGGGKKKKKGKK